MFLTRAHLDRRTFLRGVGASVALPLLDAMVPARTLLASTAASGAPRLAFVYFPHGAILDEWTPRWNGRDGALRLGRVLAPLTPFRDQLTVVSGLENRHAYGPVHAITPGTWLSGSAPSRRDASQDASASDGITADQLAADHFTPDTRLPSLSVAAEAPRRIGAGIWSGVYDESYGTTLSFRRGRVPVPMECRPRAVFDRLVGRDGAFVQESRRPAWRSVLDCVSGAADGLWTRLGPADRVVLDGYLAAVRDVERRVEQAEQDACASETTQAETERRFAERLALMFDLVALAFRADLTRVASMMMAAEASAMTYAHLGVSEPFHLLSHHQYDSDKIEQLVRIQSHHTQLFAAFVRTLAETPDGDGSLLDRTQVLFGSNMSDSHAHDHFPLPVAVVGGGATPGGRHLRCPDRTPMASLLLAMLRKAGVPAPSFGDSTDVIARQT